MFAIPNIKKFLDDYPYMFSEWERENVVEFLKFWCCNRGIEGINLDQEGFVGQAFMLACMPVRAVILFEDLVDIDETHRSIRQEAFDRFKAKQLAHSGKNANRKL